MLKVLFPLSANCGNADFKFNDDEIEINLAKGVHAVMNCLGLLGNDWFYK